MALTYDSIATTTLGTAASSITFSSISSAYTDLRIVFNFVGTGNFNTLMRFNSDSGSNYSETYIRGNGTAASSARRTSQTSHQINISSSDTTNWEFYIIDIFSYAGSTNKTSLWSLAQDRNGSGNTGAFVGLWRNTSAITSVSFTTSASNYEVGTTATLYGILRA
jgi:hypothetical protein